MSRDLHIRRAHAGMTVQDQGRPGRLDQGLSRGGAADLRALAEGAALLGQSADCAAIEMAGMGGIFEASDTPLRIALTGAPMQATLEGEPLVWNTSHLLHPGQKLSVGAARKGNYGYLHLGGGIATDPVLGSRAAHLTAGLGAALADGDTLPIGKDGGHETGLTLEVPDRFSGGTVRIVPSVQTDRFSDADLARLEATDFTRDPRSNRMGVRLKFDGDPFAARDQLNVLSEVIVPGDIQVTGDGPFVLLGECQTTGGYPRIATVLPCDMPRIAQAPAGAAIRFTFVGRAEALKLHRADLDDIAGLPKKLHPLTRDPYDIRDLLSYQLIGGVTSGEDDKEN